MTKTDILASLTRETAIVKHLATKLKLRHLSHRFSPEQRSIAELLVYLAVQLEGTVAWFLDGTWDRWEQLEGSVKNLKPKTFATAMDRQLASVKKKLAKISDTDLAKKQVKAPSGEIIPLGTALVEYTLKFAVAYRMQLFLQAKHAGVEKLSSANLWHGKDGKAH